MSQTQRGGDRSMNIQAGGDVNLTVQSHQEEKDFGIIGEIIDGLVKQLRANPDRATEDRSRKHLALNQKIKLNFPDEADRERVSEYFKFAYTRISLIQKRIESESSDTQNDIQAHVIWRYNDLKDKGSSNMQILEGLFREFLPQKQSSNVEYTILARAFILFFFDDCTIFKKTL